MEEISLRDFFNAVKRRKKVILLITLVSVLTSAFLSFFVLQPVFEGEVILSPPEINDKRLFSPLDVKNIIESTTFLENISKQMEMSKAFIDRNLSVTYVLNVSYIKVRFESCDKLIINKFFDNLLPVLSESIASDFSKKMEVYKTRLNTLSAKKELSEKKLNEIYSELQNLFARKDKGVEYYLAYSSLMGTYYSELNSIMEIEENIEEVNLIINSSHNFEYLSDPKVSSEPVRPRKFINMFAAGVSGFLFSIVLIFLIESMHGKNR